MFFYLSKILWFFANPSSFLVAVTLLAILLGAGSSARWRRWWRGLALVAGLGLGVAGFSPLGAWLLRPLEDRFPVPPLDGLDPAGIIVLGGPIETAIGAARGQVHIGEGAERLTSAVALSRRFPQARLVFTGGSSAVIEQIGPEAVDARRLWLDLGVAPERITIEDKSRNTDENARFTWNVLQPKPGQRFLLVTSAYHMARSVGLFRKAGFDVIPYPVDYRTRGNLADLKPMSPASEGLARVDLATREWTGLVAYRLTGRIDSFLPSP
jgi:uncharacterized SAM-binding protein YcdF (DUF218 family)